MARSRCPSRRQRCQRQRSKRSKPGSSTGRRPSSLGRPHSGLSALVGAPPARLSAIPANLQVIMAIAFRRAARAYFGAMQALAPVFRLESVDAFAADDLAFVANPGAGLHVGEVANGIRALL